jgi:hypothetical protein
VVVGARVRRVAGVGVLVAVGSGDPCGADDGGGDGGVLLHAAVRVNAVGEEALYRGILQNELTDTLGRAPAVVVQAAAFGFAHLNGFPSGGVGAIIAVLDAVSAGEAADPAAMAALLARQRPVWEPGAEHGYHALTFGWLVGEFVRRHTGLTVGEYVRRHFGDELWIGAPAPVVEQAARLAFPPDRGPRHTARCDEAVAGCV